MLTLTQWSLGFLGLLLKLLEYLRSPEFPASINSPVHKNCVSVVKQYIPQPQEVLINIVLYVYLEKKGRDTQHKKREAKIWAYTLPPLLKTISIRKPSWRSPTSKFIFYYIHLLSGLCFISNTWVFDLPSKLLYFLYHLLSNCRVAWTLRVPSEVIRGCLGKDKPPLWCSVSAPVPTHSL